MNGAWRKLAGDVHDSASSREGWSRAAQAAELRELHCPISVSHYSISIQETGATDLQAHSPFPV